MLRFRLKFGRYLNLCFLKGIGLRYQDKEIPRYFRGDAAFANPDIYRLLEAEDHFYAIRLKGNNILQGKV